MSNNTNKLQISPSFKAIVHDHATALLNSNDNDEFNNHELIESGRRIAGEVVSELQSEEVHTLMGFNTSQVNHIVLASGQEVDLPDTPYDGLISNRKIIEPVLFVTAAHALLGLHPVVYEGENDGRIVRNVVPAKKSADMISSHGSRVAFGGHVDNPDLPFFDDAEKHSVTIPDNLSLYCLKQQTPSVSTDVIMLDDILRQMNPESVSRLMQPVFTVERPASFSGYTDNFVSGVPLVGRDNAGQYVSRFDTHRVTSDDPTAADALEEFKAIAAGDDVKTELALEHGDFVLFKNKRTLHARGAFNPVFDGQDRWLLRVFSMNGKPPADVLVYPQDPAHLKTDINAFNI